MPRPKDPETKEGPARPSELPAVHVQLRGHGYPPGVAGYARDKIGQLARLAHRPVLFARVKLSKHDDPAVARPVIAQANLDVNGRLVRAQVEAVTAPEAVDRLEASLRHRLERLEEGWEARRGRMPSAEPHEWRHASEPTHRPSYFPRPVAEREIVRHKSFTVAFATIDEAADDMDLLDYEFHLFTEAGSGLDSLLYRAGPTGFRLAQITRADPAALDAYQLPVTLSEQPAPLLSVTEAVQRLNLTGMPFLFFLDADRGRGSVLYHRYDGHPGLISPAD